MTLQTILNRLQKLHPKEIDLSLDRVKNLCKKLGNPQKDLKYISVVGTNGKYSTIQALRAILKEANIKCNIYTSPHIQRINERFIFNDEEISDSDLSDLLVKVEEVNNGEEITYFEILTAAYFFHASKYRENINIIESGLFHRFDATNIIDKNILSIVTAIGLDHLDWLPKDEQTIEKIIFARLQEIKSGKLKNLCKNNQLFVDGSHNPLGAKVLNDYLQTLKCKKHIILGMMANKDHEEYMSYFKNISSLTTIDIPNQPNSIKGKDLKNKLDKFPNLNYEKSIEDALKKISTNKDEIILITGSLYLAGEVLNLN